MKFAHHIDLCNAILIYVESSLTYVSKFEVVLVNFNHVCLKLVLRFCTVFSVRFFGFKIMQFLRVFAVFSATRGPTLKTLKLNI